MGEKGINGLLLTFYKRKIVSKETDLQFYDYELFGYYDGLSIRKIEDWTKFSPYRINEDRSADREFAGKYTVKLLGDDNDTVELFIPEKTSPEQGLPLFGILMLNVSCDFVHDNKEEEKRRKVLQDLISQVVPENSEDAVCRLFRSVGYYDYAVLYRGKEWQSMYRLIDAMRSLHIKEDARTEIEAESCGVVSNTYFIPGLLAVETETAADAVCEKITDETYYSFAIHLNLQENTYSDKAAEKILEHIREKSPDIFTIGTWEAFQQSGSADCLISVNGIPLKTFLRQYLADGYFVPGSDESVFIEHVKGIRTSAGRPIPDGAKEEQEGQETEEKDEDDKKNLPRKSPWEKISEENSRVIKKVRDALDQYRDYALTHDLHTRQITSLYQMVSLYENMTNSSHTFDICALMIPVWDILTDNIVVSLKSLKTGDQKKDDIVEIDQMIEGLEFFRRIVGQFLQSLSYSDRSFIERIRLSGTSIGSAAMILFGYNAILCQLNRIYMLPETETGENESSKESKYALLITSGGSDITETFNFSEYAPLYFKGKINEKRIIVTRLSERSLYNPASTMLHLAHELFHYRGERERPKRAAASRKAFSAIQAAVFADIAFQPEMILFDLAKHVSSLETLIKQGKGEILLEDAAALEAELKRELQTEIAYRIDRYLEEIQKKGVFDIQDTDLAYYGKDYFDGLTGYASALFYNTAKILNSYTDGTKQESISEMSETSGLSEELTLEEIIAVKARYLAFMMYMKIKGTVSAYINRLPDELKRINKEELKEYQEYVSRITQEEKEKLLREEYRLEGLVSALSILQTERYDNSPAYQKDFSGVWGHLPKERKAYISPSPRFSTSLSHFGSK